MPSWSHPFPPQSKLILIINFVLTIPLLFFTVLSHFKSLNGIMFDVMCFWITNNHNQNSTISNFFHLCYVYCKSFSFVCSTEFHCVSISQLTSQFYCWWKVFLSQFESTEYHATMNILLHVCWCMCWRVALGYIYRNGIGGLQSICILNLAR